MRPALGVLDEVRMRGGAAYRLGDRVRIIPASDTSPLCSSGPGATSLDRHLKTGH